MELSWTDSLAGAEDDPAPHTVRVRRTPTYAAAVLVDKVCLASVGRAIGIRHVRVYPVTTPDLKNVTDAPELERDCP